MVLASPTTMGRYELLAELGRGGMAELYLARARGVAGFSKLFALKRILPHLAGDAQFRSMFVNEGRIAAPLSHPNICHVFELGEENGELFLVMELLNGVAWDVAMPVLPEGAARVPLVASMIVQACEGLHHAHELRDHDGRSLPIVHRDVSPQNLFVTTSGTCKVLDFGVSKMLGKPSHTRTGVIKGKLPYMAPEQIEGAGVDARTDVFSLGVVLWESITGRRLFERETDFLIWKAITEEPVPPAGSRELDPIIARALARDREHRFGSAKLLADAVGDTVRVAGRDELAAFLRDRCAAPLAARAHTVASAIDRIEPGASATIEELRVGSTVSLRPHSVEVVAPQARRRGTLAAIAGVAAMLVVLALVFARSTSRSPDRSARTESAAEQHVQAAVKPPEVPVAVQHATVTAPDAQLATRDAPASAAKPHAPRGNTPSKARVRASEPPPPAPAPQNGRYSIDSEPYATIYLDDNLKPLGVTPLFRVAVPEGTHRIRAVLEDGRERALRITIVAGQEISSGQLTWDAR